jgi:NADH dehydrogenase FAD-containing subunit
VNLLQARQVILGALQKKTLNLIVIGGGPAGVEIAANLWRALRQSHKDAQITLIGGKKLLAGFPEAVRNYSLDSLRKRKIQVVEGTHVQKIQGGVVSFADEKSQVFDFALIAVGVKPLPLFRNSNLPCGEDGGLLVNSHLQSVTHPEIFGGGDCISLTGRRLAKVGVYAVRQNPVLFHNLLAALEGRTMESFIPQKDYMLILNMGNSRGIAWKKNWVWEGRLAFLLKDYIDRKFMKKFQVSGEREEG